MIPNNLVRSKSLLKSNNSKAVTKEFEWRAKTGVFYAPRNMKTSHVFFTLKMIWNHSTPEHMHIVPFKSYRFSDYYTIGYMTKAVRHLSKELAKRSDLSLHAKKCLRIIQGHLNSDKRLNR